MAVRDKEWLTLEACREFQRGTCSRTEQECKYAHPSNSVVVENGRVIACYDSMKGQCTRENCRYLHPPPHLKTQLEIKGQNNIAARRMLQNAHLQNQILAQGNPIPVQPTLLSTVPTSLPSGTSPVAAATSQANAEANAAYYHGHQYVIPVAVTMAPTVTHSTLNQHMYPGSYLSQAMQTALPTVATSNALPGSANSTAHPGFSDIPLQTPIIPNAIGAPSFQLLQPKAKNDRLEYHKSPSNPVAGVSPYHRISTTPTAKQLPTNRKRPREEDDQLLLMWNYFKDDSTRWQNSSEYSSYAQSHPSLACFPRPPKVQASMVSQPQLAQSPMFPSNLVYNPLPPAMTVMAQPQFLPAPLPVMPTFPLMAPHFINHQNTSETLPVCRDFKSGNCKRPNCKYAHVVEDYVEITDGKVTVCRYAVQNRCTRPRCKFYHPPTTPVAMVNSIPSLPTPGVTNA